MTFDVNEFQVGQPITFNFEELKSELTEKVQHYKTLVYTDDQVADAKKDKANLNKLREAIETRRKEIKKECLKPYEDFEVKVKEIVAILDEPIGLIDKQVKEFESKKKEDKREQIELLWDEIDAPEWLGLSQIWDDKWLNATTSLKSIRESIENTITRIRNELSVIASLPHSEECEILYRECLDLAMATKESQRIAEIQKAVEASKMPTDNIPEPEELIEHYENDVKMTVRFEAELTVSEAKELKAWFKAHNIKIKQI